MPKGDPLAAESKPFRHMRELDNAYGRPDHQRSTAELVMLFTLISANGRHIQRLTTYLHTLERNRGPRSYVLDLQRRIAEAQSCDAILRRAADVGN